MYSKGLVALMLLGLSGCSSEKPDIRSGPPAVVVDGNTIDCSRSSVVTVAGSAELVVEGASTEAVTLDGRQVTLMPASDGPASIGELSLAPESVSHLVLSDSQRFPDGQCVVYLRHSPSEGNAMRTLTELSGGGVTVARSLDTGGVSEIALTVGLDGDGELEELAHRFLIDHLDVFGVTADALLPPESYSSPSGWSVYSYRQQHDGVPVFNAGLQVHVDAERRVRWISSTLIPTDLAESPHEDELGDIHAAVSGALTSPDDRVQDILSVYFSPIDITHRGAPVLRAGWWVRATTESLLVEDDSRGVVLRTESGSAQVEVSGFDPAESACSDSYFMCLQTETDGRWNIASGSSALSDPTNVNSEAPLSEAGVSLWKFAADVANYAEEATGQEGWQSYPQAWGWDELSAGTVRFVAVDSPVATGRYLPSTRVVAIAPRFMAPDVIAHEYGHMLDADLGPGPLGSQGESRVSTNNVVLESIADLFAVTHTARGSSSPPTSVWNYGEDTFGTPLRAIPSAERLSLTLSESGGVVPNGVRQGQRSIDDPEDANYYGNTFPITRGVFLATQESPHAASIRRVERLAVDALGWDQINSRKEFRDRWLVAARAYARSGEHGFSDDDVCAFARGFRSTGLDGEYGNGSDAAAPPANTDLICTDECCPLCGEECGHEDDDDPVGSEGPNGPMGPMGDGGMSCMPRSCEPNECGEADDGCGGTLDCGRPLTTEEACGAEVCEGGDCTPPANCGLVVGDGCGGDITCPPCDCRSRSQPRGCPDGYTAYLNPISGDFECRNSFRACISLETDYDESRYGPEGGPSPGDGERFTCGNGCGTPVYCEDRVGADAYEGIVPGTGGWAVLPELVGEADTTSCCQRGSPGHCEHIVDESPDGGDGRHDGNVEGMFSGFLAHDDDPTGRDDVTYSTAFPGTYDSVTWQCSACAWGNYYFTVRQGGGGIYWCDDGADRSGPGEFAEPLDCPSEPEPLEPCGDRCVPAGCCS